MLATGGTESGALIGLVRQLEERAMDTARELAQVRQLVAVRESALHDPTASTGRKQNPQPRIQESTNRSAAGSSQLAMQKVEKQLREAEVRIAEQDQQIEMLRRRAEILRSDAAMASERASHFQTELQWERLNKSPQSGLHPTPPTSTPHHSHTQREPHRIEPRSVPASAPPERRSPSAAAPVATPMPLGYSVPQRKATDNPEIMAVAYYVLHERFLPLIAQRRPDLTKRIQQELSEERSGLQIICRAVARRLEVVVQNDRDQFQNLNRLATETLHELREQLDANPAQRALAEPWFAHERSVLTQLVQDMALAILDVSLRPKQNPVDTAAHPGNQQQHRGRQSRIEEEEEEPSQDDEQEDGEQDDEQNDDEPDDDEEQNDDDEQGEDEEGEEGEDEDEDDDEENDDDEEEDDDDDDEEKDEDDY